MCRGGRAPVVGGVAASDAAADEDDPPEWRPRASGFHESRWSPGRRFEASVTVRRSWRGGVDGAASVEAAVDVTTSEEIVAASPEKKGGAPRRAAMVPPLVPKEKEGSAVKAILKYVRNVDLNGSFHRGASYARFCFSHTYKQSSSFVQAMNRCYHEVSRFRKAIRRQYIPDIDRPDVFFLGGSISRSCISLITNSRLPCHQHKSFIIRSKFLSKVR